MSTHPSTLLKAPSLLAVLLVQVSVLWERLYEVGKAAALPFRIRLLEAANVARLAAIATLQDPSWLGVTAPPTEELTQSASTSQNRSADPWQNEPAGAIGWWERIPTTPKNFYSKNGEDGILLYLVRNVEYTMKQYVDLGADGGRGTSTTVFRKTGWRGTSFSSLQGNPAIRCYKEQLFPNNVVTKFAQYKIPKHVDVMVVDLDANDAHVVRELWKAGYRPRIMMMESNDNFGEDSVLSFPPNHAFLTHQWTNCGQVCSYTLPNGTTKRVICGAAVRGLMRMGDNFGYVSMYLNKHNLFLVRGDLLSSRVRELWTHDHVFNLSRAFGRRKLPFPRKECNSFMSGLVPLVQEQKKAGTTAAPPRPKTAPPRAAAGARGSAPGKLAGTPRPAVRPGKPLQNLEATKSPLPWWAKLPSPLRRAHIDGDEEGILGHLLKHIETHNHRYVEFPAGDGSVTLSRLLREESNWTGILLDCCHSDPSINLHKEDITSESIVGLLTKYKVQRELDYLAVGQLANSAFVLRSIFQAGFRPRIISISVNPNFGDDSRLSFPDKNVTKRRESACGPVCSFPSGDGEKTLLCGVGVSGLLNITKAAVYRNFYLSKTTLFMVREGLFDVSLIFSWTMPALLNHSHTKLGREALEFPREECNDFVDGLVEVPVLNTKPPAITNRWWERLPAHPRKIHSQNDEDGIIMHIFQNVKPKNKQYFEFGSEDGSETNTRALRSLGWRGTNLDQGFENHSINLFKEFVSPDNILSLLGKYKVPTDVDILSVDVDSFDFHILRSILLGGYRPRLLIVETNDNFGEDSTLTYPGHTVLFWDWSPACGQVCAHLGIDGTVQTSTCGASVRGLAVLGASAGYRPLYLNKVNLFLIRGDLIPSEAAQNWTFQAVLDRSVGLGRVKKEFPIEACQKYMEGLVEVEPLPPSDEAIALDSIMPVAPSMASSNPESTPNSPNAEPTGGAKAPTPSAAGADSREEPEEDSVTAWLKAAAKAARDARAGKALSKDGKDMDEEAATKAAETTSVDEGGTLPQDSHGKDEEVVSPNLTAANETPPLGNSTEGVAGDPSPELPLSDVIETGLEEAADALPRPTQESDAAAGDEAANDTSRPRLEKDATTANGAAHSKVNTVSTSVETTSSESSETLDQVSDAAASLEDGSSDPLSTSTSTTTDSPPEAPVKKKKKKKKGQKK